MRRRRPCVSNSPKYWIWKDGAQAAAAVMNWIDMYIVCYTLTVFWMIQNVMRFHDDVVAGLEIERKRVNG